jgi:pyrroline-5-carboxylate reductase
MAMQISIIGAGNIGRALIGGLVRGKHVEPGSIYATRRTASALEELRNDFIGIQTGSDNRAAVDGADVVVLAVKPAQAHAVLADVAGAVRSDALVISILAGITTESIATALRGAQPVVRAMPNTPMLVDEGATAIATGTHATAEHEALARRFFEAVGKVEVVPEHLMDAVTGLSGSGPAYIYMVIEALTDAGVKQGLPRPISARLAAQTVYGAAKLVIDTGKHPAILRDEVTTPGGTAIAAIAELEDRGLRTMLINAVAVATRRSYELSGADKGDKQ